MYVSQDLIALFCVDHCFRHTTVFVFIDTEEIVYDSFQ